MVWFAMAQCDLMVPSFSKTKKFQLPGIISPFRVSDKTTYMSIKYNNVINFNCSM